MIYKSVFDILGTPLQQQIIIDALDKIHFQWDKLKPPLGVFKIGWGNLNNQSIGQAAARAHIGYHPGDTDIDRIVGEVGEKRNYTLGVFYTKTGNSFIDNYLVNYPDIAQTTVAAELGHLIDYFLPTFTDETRKQLNLLAHGGVDVPHSHTAWWEVNDYNTEYYDLVGESWMAGFTYAYSDMDFDMSSFTHKFTKAQAPAIRKIIGLERTDYVPPIPAPEPAPVPLREYKVYGTSKIYHRLTHNAKKPGTRITDLTGLTPCKTCKP